MRTLHEIEWDIDSVQREMSKLVIAQSDMDEQLRHYEYRLKALEKERLEKLSSGDGQL